MQISAMLPCEATARPVWDRRGPHDKNAQLPNAAVARGYERARGICHAVSEVAGSTKH